MPPFKTFTPLRIPTTAVLLLALASCEDNNRQIDEKPGDAPNQAIDQRIETHQGRAGQAEQRTDSNRKMAFQPNARGTSTGGTGGTSTSGTSTGGTSTGGTSTGTTGTDKPPTTTGTTTSTTDQDP